MDGNNQGSYQYQQGNYQYPQNQHQQNTSQQGSYQYQQNHYTQNQYPQNYQYQYPAQQNLEAPLSVGEWFLTTLVMIIPVVNLIMLFVWAFGSGNKSRSNWSKAQLIWLVIGIAISIVLGIVGVSIFGVMNRYF